MQEVQCSRSLPGKQKLQAGHNLQTRQPGTQYHYLAHALAPAGLRRIRFLSLILLFSGSQGLPPLTPNAAAMADTRSLALAGLRETSDSYCRSRTTTGCCSSMEAHTL